MQLLEEWTPVYRLKHVIGAARRLFLDSKQLIVEKKPVDKKRVAKEYDTLQNRIEAMEQRVSDTSDEMVNAYNICLLYTSPSPRDRQKSRMPSSA